MAKTLTEDSHSSKRAILPRTRVTMADVARAADVSKALVSRVLNKVESQIPIPQETIRRIERIAAELNYVPSRSARSLKRGNRLNLIGVSIRTGIPPGIHQTEEEMLPSKPLPEEYRHTPVHDVMAYERSFSIGLIIDALWQNSNPTVWDLVIQHRPETSEDPLRGTDLGLDLVDGLLYMQPTLQHREYLNFVRSGYPIVVIGHISGIEEDVCAVGIDNPKAAALLVDHLYRLNRRKMVALWPYGEYVGLTIGRNRGFNNRLSAYGLEPLGVSFIGSDLSPARGYWMTLRMLDQHPDLDAMVVGTDDIARGAIYALQERGRRIPEDVSVVTFDDKPITIIEPPLITALRIPFPEITRQAVKLLMDLIQGKVHEPVHIEIEPELVVRQSCGAAMLSGM